MDDEEEMEIPSPEEGSPGHFILQGNPVISSPPQMVREIYCIFWNIWVSNQYSSTSDSSIHLELFQGMFLNFQVGGALPRLPPLPRAGIVSPSNKTNGSINSGGAYNCTICMESFSKVGLLNKHIISNHSTGTTLTPTQGSSQNR